MCRFISGRGQVAAKKKLNTVSRLLTVGAPTPRSFISSWNARSSSGVALSGACPRNRVKSRIARRYIVCVFGCRPLIRISCSSQSGRIIIDLSENQIGKFAGNAIELQGSAARLLALSETALNALTPDQKARISDSATLVALKIPTIELSGGSVRCTIAGIHLTSRV
jgi:hypothetical protein